MEEKIPEGYVLATDAVFLTGMSEQRIRNNIHRKTVDSMTVGSRRYVNLSDVLDVDTRCPEKMFTPELALEWERTCRRLRKCTTIN